MNYSSIKYFDIANGEGVRTSLFVSGCRRHCPGCFNAQTWSFAFGNVFTEQIEEEILASLEPSYVDGLSLLGGEPMEPENRLALAGLCEKAKARFPQKSIWCYTGFTYEELCSSECDEAGRRLLACVDVLVDGPFVEDLKDITLRFRGSSNQRVIDLCATRSAGEVKLWEDEEIYATHTIR